MKNMCQIKGENLSADIKTIIPNTYQGTNAGIKFNLHGMNHFIIDKKIHNSLHLELIQDSVQDCLPSFSKINDNENN